MKDLQNYTDDQLREELQRRARERRANTPREIVYKEFEATIVQIYNVKQKYNGHTYYFPFEQWSYKVDGIVSDFPSINRSKIYKLARGVFKKDNAPKVGDRVKLRYRRCKRRYEGFDMIRQELLRLLKERSKV